MYCQEDDVKSLFLKLQENFPGSEMVCEVFNSVWLSFNRVRIFRRRIILFDHTSSSLYAILMVVSNYSFRFLLAQ